MPEYLSSEEVQRQNAADVFLQASKAKEDERASEKDRLKKAIDRYIDKHNSTIGVRTEAKKQNRTNDYQLDLSADIVEILKELKGELR